MKSDANGGSDDPNGVKSGADGGNNGGNLIQTQLDEYEALLIMCIAEEPDITYEGIAKATGMSERTIHRRIQDLKGKGVLRRIGGTRGSWEVNQ